MCFDVVEAVSVQGGVMDYYRSISLILSGDRDVSICCQGDTTVNQM